VKVKTKKHKNKTKEVETPLIEEVRIIEIDLPKPGVRVIDETSTTISIEAYEMSNENTNINDYTYGIVDGIYLNATKWQSSPVFTRLEPNHTYSVTAFRKAFIKDNVNYNMSRIADRIAVHTKPLEEDSEVALKLVL